LIAILLLGLLLVPVVLIAIYGKRKAGTRIVNDPWACGYGYSNKMSVTAGNFDQPVAVTFSVIYALHSVIQKPLDAISSWAKRARDAISNAEPVLENIIKQPITRSVNYAGQHIQSIQMGDIRMYCLYIVLTLVILLIAIFK
jgi:hydrogenase-4 component B